MKYIIKNLEYGKSIGRIVHWKIFFLNGKIRTFVLLAEQTENKRKCYKEFFEIINNELIELSKFDLVITGYPGKRFEIDLDIEYIK